MTYLLDQAFRAARALPEAEQDAIAAAILAEIQDERQAEAFALSPEMLSARAEDALSVAYASMAADEAREAEAEEWTEGLLGDVADEAR